MGGNHLPPETQLEKISRLERSLSWEREQNSRLRSLVRMEESRPSDHWNPLTQTVRAFKCVAASEPNQVKLFAMPTKKLSSTEIDQVDSYHILPMTLAAVDGDALGQSLHGIWVGCTWISDVVVERAYSLLYPRETFRLEGFSNEIISQSIPIAPPSILSGLPKLTPPKPKGPPKQIGRKPGKKKVTPKP